MNARYNSARYTKVAVALHWLVAIGIIFNLYHGLGFDNLDKSHHDQLGAAIALHKSIGITVLGLVVLRVLWRIAHPAPAPMAGLKPWEVKFSLGTHHLLYLLMFLVPFSGWLHDAAWKGAVTHPLVLFNTIPFFRLPFFNGLDPVVKEQWHSILDVVHSYAAYALLAAVLVHVAGALKHQFLDHSPALQRMWFGR